MAQGGSTRLCYSQGLTQAFGSLRLGDLFVSTYTYPPRLVRLTGWSRHSEQPQCRRHTVFVQDVDVPCEHNLMGTSTMVLPPEVFDVVPAEPVRSADGGHHKCTLGHHSGTPELHLTEPPGRYGAACGARLTFRRVRRPAEGEPPVVWTWNPL